MQELITVATFRTPEEAQLARNNLEAAGVRAVVTDGTTIGMDWMLGNALGGVKVQVRLVDVEQARAVLYEREGSSSPPGVSQGAWQCSRCGEQVEAGFEICWSCGASRDGREDPGFAQSAVMAEEPKPQDDSPSLADAGTATAEETFDSCEDRIISLDDADSAQFSRVAIVGLVALALIGFIYWRLSQ